MAHNPSPQKRNHNAAPSPQKGGGKARGTQFDNRSPGGNQKHGSGSGPVARWKGSK